MKEALASMMFLILTATSAFAHAGHVHTYMGTVTTLSGDSAFMLKTSDGKTVTVETSNATKFLHADGHAATKADLAEGMRVVVKMSTDGKTALSVKMSAPRK